MAAWPCRPPTSTNPDGGNGGEEARPPTDALALGGVATTAARGDSDTPPAPPPLSGVRVGAAREKEAREEEAREGEARGGEAKEGELREGWSAGRKELRRSHGLGCGRPVGMEGRALPEGWSSIVSVCGRSACFPSCAGAGVDSGSG
jgi:hypothetical protein